MKKIAIIIMFGVMLLLGLEFQTILVNAIPNSSWGTAEIIETNTISAYKPQVAINPSGNAVAVWVQCDGTRWNIWSNNYICGVGWRTTTLIETDNSGDAMYPQVVIDPSGNAVAVWKQSDGTRYNIWSNRYIFGVGWGTATLIETDNSGNTFAPQIAVDPSGNAVAVWQHYDGTRHNIWSNRYIFGVGWGTATLIETDNSGNTFAPQIAVDPSGNAVAVWYQYDGARYHIWSNQYTSGTGWGTEELIETDTRSAFSPQVAVDSSGNAVAVWHQDDGTRYNIWSNRYTSGTGWGTATPIETDNSGDATAPQVAVDPSGNSVAVWFQDDGTRYNIWSNRYTSGTGWGTATLIETDNSGDATVPQVAVDPSGNAVVVWNQDDGTRYNIWSNRYTAGVGWGPATLIETDNSGDATVPQVAVNPSGNAVAVWQHYDGTRYNIYSNRYINSDITPPHLSLTSPSDGMDTDIPIVTVSGTTEPGAILNINGIMISVRPDGSFSCNIALINGHNIINVTASDDWGNGISLLRNVTYSNPVPSIVEDLISIQNSIQTLSSQQDSINQLLDALSARIDSTDSQLLLLKDLILVLEMDFNSTTNHFQSIQRNLSILMENLNATDLGLDQLQDLIDAMIDDLNETGSDIQSFWTRIDLVERDIVNTNSDIAETNGDIDEIKEGQDKLKEDIDTNIDDIKAIQAIIGNLIVVMIIGVIILMIMMLVFFFMMLSVRKKSTRNQVYDFE